MHLPQFVFALVASAGVAQAQFGPSNLISSELASLCELIPVDVDGDGDPDLVAHECNGTQVTWIEQVGLFTGEFDCPKDLLELTVGAQTLDAGDLDGDGLPDLVFTRTVAEEVSVAWNEGGGAFTVPQSLGSVPAALRGALLVDINGDQRIDILVPSEGSMAGTNPPQVLVNQGGRAFAASTAIPGMSSPARELHAGDFDGDGDLDLVIRNVADSRHFYRNQQGTFVFAGGLGGGGTVTPTIAIVDMDGDGDIDVVSAREELSARTVVVLNENLDGNGTFGSQVAVTIPGRDAVIADIDADGLPDVVVCNLSVDPPTMWRNDGSFGFDAPMAILQQNIPGVFAAAATDMDGDGLPDILFTQLTNLTTFSRAARLLRSEAGGAFPPFESDWIDLTGRVEGAVGIATADFDEDGDIDVIAGSNDRGVHLAEGLGFGDFTGAKPIPEANGLNVRSTRASDLDGDGAIDIVVRTNEGDLMWLAGGGDLTFSAPALIGALGTVGGIGPRLVDLDLDGDLDVLGVMNAGQSVLAWDQTSPGVFAAARVVATSVRPIRQLEVGNIDGTAGIDMVMSVELNGQRSRVRFFASDGTGSFLAGQSVAISTGLISGLAIADLDLDGDQDVAWNNPDTARVEGAENVDGTGTFGALLDLAAGDADGARLQAADVSGTDHPDFLLRRDSRTIQVVRSLGSFTYAPLMTPISVPNDLSDFATLDVDSDGDLDVLATIPGDGRLEWFSNLDLVSPGLTYCSPAVTNSSGQAGVLSTIGSSSVGENDLTLRVSRLPGNTLTLLLTSRFPDFVPNAGTSVGTLCLSGSIGRFVGPGQVLVTTPDGTAALTVDVTQLPQPMGSASAVSGAVWYFQAWFRDSVGGQATSNFTDGSCVTFTM